MQIQQLHLLVAPKKEWRILKNFVMNNSKSGNCFTAMGLPTKRNWKLWVYPSSDRSKTKRVSGIILRNVLQWSCSIQVSVWTGHS